MSNEVSICVMEGKQHQPPKDEVKFFDGSIISAMGLRSRYKRLLSNPQPLEQNHA
ncbi:hypothetical protein [Agrobacterium fabrum]|uniref:hypothetical protein n=1 Tax=Agrobacterium fabrum TaxID=1176649 RepID=UPI003BA01EBC